MEAVLESTIPLPVTTNLHAKRGDCTFGRPSLQPGDVCPSDLCRLQPCRRSLPITTTASFSSLPPISQLFPSPWQISCKLSGRAEDLCERTWTRIAVSPCLHSLLPMTGEPCPLGDQLSPLPWSCRSLVAAYFWGQLTQTDWPAAYVCYMCANCTPRKQWRGVELTSPLGHSFEPYFLIKLYLS